MKPACRLLLCAIALSPMLAAASPDAVTQPGAPDYSTCAKPDYPKAALRGGQEGTVKLEFLVGADGTAKSAAVAATSSHPLLDSAALEGIRRCRFKPGTRDGKAVESKVNVIYEWSLQGGPIADPLAHVHEFLIKARHADAIADPLQRCLAFPDFPGNQWPAGLAQSYCHLLAGETITLAVVADHIGRGAYAALETLYRRDLERHFSKDNFSEVIHRDFESFDASDRANALTQQWIDNAPESPFANAARGEYLRAVARKVRGDKWAQETPAENMERMSDHIGMALHFYGKALRIEPRLLAVHASLVHVATLDKRSALRERAFARGQAIDPSCQYLSMRYMAGLQPRWGGSLGAMREYAVQLAAYVPTRPLLALNIVMPAYEQGRILAEEKRYAEAVNVFEPASKLAPYPELFEYLGTNMQYSGGNDWESLVRLLVAYRYSNNEHGAVFARGRLLLSVAGDPAWAIGLLRRASELNPEWIASTMLLGRAYRELGEYDQSETHFTRALADPLQHMEALYSMINLAAARGRLEDASRHAALFTKTYPENSSGWFLQGDVYMHMGAQAEAIAAYQRFLALVEKNKDRMSGEVAQAKRYLGGDRDPAFTGVAKEKR